MKPFYKSKTFWANLITVAIAILILVATSRGVAGDRLVLAYTGDWLLLVAGILNIVLRLVTHKPIDISYLNRS